MRRAEGCAKNFGVFRVKNHDFTPKNHIFSNCRGRRENFWVFRVKNHDLTPTNHFFSNFSGGAPPQPPLDPPLIYIKFSTILTIIPAEKHKANHNINFRLKSTSWFNLSLNVVYVVVLSNLSNIPTSSVVSMSYSVSLLFTDNSSWAASAILMSWVNRFVNVVSVAPSNIPTSSVVSMSKSVSLFCIYIYINSPSCAVSPIGYFDFVLQYWQFFDTYCKIKIHIN